MNEPEVDRSQSLQAARILRHLSLPAGVSAFGGIVAWNSRKPELKAVQDFLERSVTAKTVRAVISEVRAVRASGSDFSAYNYLRTLRERNYDLCYATLLSAPTELLPCVYTPAVGEACQKYGILPMQRRGCYISITLKGQIKAILIDYAKAELEKDANGKYICDCMVFSDGGRILGLGDLGAWGMGIPMGKLDLYTVCGGFNPKRTIPVIIDAGCGDADHNTDHCIIRDHPLYTGLKQDRKTHKSDAGTNVNSCYYGPGNIILEFMEAVTEVFGKTCLMQFEDFNSNDAFPLLEAFRTKFLCYNDDIQGTAAVCVSGLMGAAKLQNPGCKDLASELRKQRFLFHGSGSANIGAMQLLTREVGVPKSQIFCTNSSGVIWVEEDGSSGSFKNNEQKEFAMMGKPSFDTRNLVTAVENLKPNCLIGAVGVQPGCFTKEVVEAMLKVNPEQRPVIFALSNPKTQAEVTAEHCYTWSQGRAIFGSGTMFNSVNILGKLHEPGQVNNVYIFPGLSFGCVCCGATSVPDALFRVGAEAVAHCLDDKDMKLDRVVPHVDRIRDVGLAVASAVAFECQNLGIATNKLGSSLAEVREKVKSMRWSPSEPVLSSGAKL